MKPDFWNERYGGTGDYVYGREPNDFLREVAERIPKGRVLCIADGEGRNSVFLVGLGYEVVSVDFSVEAQKKAARLAEEKGVTVSLVHADLSTWQPDDDSYEGVVAIFAHFPEDIRRRVNGWIPRALKKGGVLVLEAYRPAQLAYDTGGPKDVTMLMPLATLEHELAGLTFEIGREIERDVQEGIFHGGKSATTQVVARRPS